MFPGREGECAGGTGHSAGQAPKEKTQGTMSPSPVRAGQDARSENSGGKSSDTRNWADEMSDGEYTPLPSPSNRTTTVQTTQPGGSTARNTSQTLSPGDGRADVQAVIRSQSPTADAQVAMSLPPSQQPAVVPRHIVYQPQPQYSTGAYQQQQQHVQSVVPMQQPTYTETYSAPQQEWQHYYSGTHEQYQQPGHYNAQDTRSEFAAAPMHQTEQPQYDPRMYQGETAGYWPQYQQQPHHHHQYQDPTQHQLQQQHPVQFEQLSQQQLQQQPPQLPQQQLTLSPVQPQQLFQEHPDTMTPPPEQPRPQQQQQHEPLQQQRQYQQPEEQSQRRYEKRQHHHQQNDTQAQPAQQQQQQQLCLSGRCKVRVQFKYGRQADFISDAPVQSNAHVIVEGDRGEDLGIVSECTKWRPGQLQSRQGGTILRVLREASPQEIHFWSNSLTNQEHDSIATAQQIVNRKKIPIKIVQAEYQFDQQKLTFYFVSEDGHPLFREALAECYAVWKCRIWFARYNPRTYGRDPKCTDLIPAGWDSATPPPPPPVPNTAGQRDAPRWRTDAPHRHHGRGLGAMSP
eukprot:Hpha_TRINITY_DN16733_c0_g3::TRINITY_DN16733_c0_g3_i1::g.80289::m.80289